VNTVPAMKNIPKMFYNIGLRNQYKFYPTIEVIIGKRPLAH